MKDDITEIKPEEKEILVLEKGTDPEAEMLGLCCYGTFMPFRAL